MAACLANEVMLTADSQSLLPPETRSPNPSRFWPHAAMICWGLAFLGLCGRTLLMTHDTHSVYPVFTTAAGRWMRGSLLYVRGGTEEFRYSPLIAAFFVPFRLMPERVGHFLWRSLNFLTYLAGLLACCRAMIPRRFSADAAGVLFLLLIPLSIGSLNNAQSNPLVIGLMLFAVAAVVGRRWWVCAACIAVSTLFKLYPLSLGMLLVLLYPRPLGWRLAACLAVGVVLPFALQHPGYVAHQYGVWGHYLVTEDRQGGPMSDWYKDARSVWRVYVEPIRASTYLLAEVLGGGVLAAAVLMSRRAGGSLGRLLGYTVSLACCWMTALGPATESTTYILLAPAAVWPLLERDDPSPLRIGFTVAYGLLVASSALLWFGTAGKAFRDRLQLQPVAGLLLLALLLIDGWRRNRRLLQDRGATVPANASARLAG